MELASGIYRKYQKPFILDEDGLRRIEGVLQKAVNDYPEQLTLVYHVEREDDRFFETHDLEEVLLDPNVSEKRITLLGIELLKENGEQKNRERIVAIVFDKDKPPFPEADVRVRISSPNKTWALMLADAIDPQITRLFKIKELPSWIFYIYALLFCVIGYKVAIMLGFDKIEALKDGVYSALLFIVLCLFFGFYLSVKKEKSWLNKYFVTEPIFFFGDELNEYPEREKTKQNIFWAVLVAFLVSFLASLVSLIF